jgi:hypothetical protein
MVLDNSREFAPDCGDLSSSQLAVLLPHGLRPHSRHVPFGILHSANESAQTVSNHDRPGAASIAFEWDVNLFTRSETDAPLI